jgi:O-acetyl-ADP-ribose deacetylase (regulator of RNase III)
MKYVTGNLIELADAGKFTMIIHGCNCFKRMKSGVALAVKTRWPEAEKADTDFYLKAGDKSVLGRYSVAGQENLLIVNAYTQYTNLDEDIYVGDAGLFNLTAFVKAMVSININYGAFHRIGIPKIGSHLAKGDWNIIEQVLDGIGFQNLTCVVLPVSP